MKRLSLAILQTLAYGDLFDYPLKKSEIWLFLISNFRIPNSKFQINFKSSNSKFQNKSNYFFLKNREKIIKIRKERERWSQRKIEIAQKVANWLKIVPWIKMVAVTGSLAMKNSAENDDIDLLIVTNKNRLWLSRLFSVLLIELMGRRRRPGDKKFKDKICLNMFLDEDHLAVSEKEQDLFTAHEVVQLKPIWDKNGIYQKFLESNLWVKKYLANAIMEIRSQKYEVRNGKIENFLILLCNFSFLILNFTFVEKLAKIFQLRYMKSRRTTETIEPGRILFHPQDARGWILVEYEKRITELGIKSK